MASTLHMIGNAHIDPVWLWRWQEGFHEVKATFRSALDRLAEFDDFVFTSSSAAFYEWVEQSDPAMLDEIRQRVREGRWEITGGWWIQPDCNIPSGESLVRQGLYGQRYFQETFGVKARVGYNVDSFGHCATLPQILKQSGLDYYVFMRPHPYEKGLPDNLFRWEADDGSRVLALRLPFQYQSGPGDMDAHIRRCAGQLRSPLNESVCFFGVGNHGGGPTIANIECVQRLQGDSDLPTLRFSTPDRFFAAVEARIESEGLAPPIVHDELQHHASGCYAAHSAIKRWNRRAEALLLAAETFSSVALRTTEQPYPGGDLDRAWKGVLFNQFHDILAGTSLESTYDDARDLYGEAMSIGGRALNLAMQSLAWQIRIEPHDDSHTDTPIVVFNPHAWPSRAPVEMEVGGFGPLGDSLIDDEGRSVPMQWVQSEATTNMRKRLCFVAKLPALGYRTYRLVKDVPSSESRREHSAVQPIEASDGVLDNGSLRLAIDGESGCIASLRLAGVELFNGLAAVPVVIDDPSDTWSHGVLRFDRAIGRFAPLDVRLIEQGAVRATLRVTSEWGRSTLIQEFTLYREIDRVDVRVLVDWREHFKALKLRFPVNVNLPRAVYEIPFGHIERATNGEEEPGGRWLDVSGIVHGTGDYGGLSLLNDGKYSFDVTGHEMGLTVLRSPIYAHHVPTHPEPDGHYSFIDQGEQRFTYSLLPHAGDWETINTPRHAAEVDQPPLPMVATYHVDGTLPQRASFLSVDAPNVNVTALKKAQADDSLILRCRETHGCNIDAVLQWTRPTGENRHIEARFKAHEIKTFRVPADEQQSVVEVNLLEEPFPP